MASGSKIAAPSDPTRPEWSILGKLTRNPDLFRPGLSDAAAAALMRSALEQAWTERPDEVLAACCAKHLRSRSNEMANKRGQFSEYVNFLKDRLWLNNERGHIPEAENKERGPSAFGIQYWKPESGGLASYMRARVNWLQSDWDAEQAEKGKSVSTEVLAANGTDLSDNGEFVRKPRMNLDDADISEASADGIDLREAHNDLRREAVAEERAAKATADDLSAEEIAHSKSEAEIVAEGRAQRLNALRQTSVEESLLRSPNRNEYAFFSVALGRTIEPADAPEDREHQLRQIASETIEKVCHDMPDREDVQSALVDWEPGKRSFFQYFPEVSEFIVEKAAQPQWGEPNVNKNAEAVAQLMGLTEEKMPEQGVSPQQQAAQADAALDQPADFFSEHELGMSTLHASAMWNARATEQTINSPERPDYIFLCEKFRIEPEEDLAPEELHRRVKEMAMEWLVHSSRNSDFTNTLFPKLQEWQPSQGFLGETMMEALSEIARQRVTEVQAQAPAQQSAGSAYETLAALRKSHPDMAEEDLAAELDKRAPKRSVVAQQPVIEQLDLLPGSDPSL